MAAQVPQIPTCSTHPSEVVALFCVSCDKGICMTCVIENSHRQHQLCKPDQIIEVKKKEFKELMQNEGEDNMCEVIGQQVKLIAAHKATVTDHRSQTATEMTNRSKELVQLIEKENEGLLMHSKRLHDQELNLLSDQESVALRCLSYIEKHRSDPESFLDKQNVLEVMRDLKLVKAYTAPTDIKTVVTFDVSHQVTEGDVKKMFGTLKEGQKVASAKKAEPAYKHLELVKYIDKFISREHHQMPHYSAITKISPIDMQAAFTLINNTDLFRVQFEVGQQRLTTKRIAQGVRDITQVRKDCIYLCTEREVKFCTLKGDIHVLDNVSPDTVRSVALTAKGNVLVCSEKNIKVSRQQDAPINTQSQLCTLDPAGINQGTTSTVYRDAGNMYRIEEHCGKPCYLGKGSNGGALQQDGDYRRIYKAIKNEDRYTGNIGNTPAQSFDPRGICCDDRDQIIIADYRNNALHMLNKNWQFERFLLREWDGLRKPTAITLYNGFLWIGQEDGSIQIRKYEP